MNEKLKIFLPSSGSLSKGSLDYFEKSENETKERLEQLRAIDNNMKINVILAKYFSSGIDTKKDLEDYIKSFKK